jgi:gliding-associated putative ABC transporter substrate-binding component GldG
MSINKKNMRSSILLFLAVLAALNVAAQMYFGRLDVSEGKLFTLSDYSRQIVQELEDKVTVKVFFSEDVGPQYNQNRVYIRDILADYHGYSKGLFNFEMVDPREKESFETEARKYQIQPVQAQVIENDQMTVKLVYMGLTFLSGEKTETIPFLGEVSGLEYLITSTVRRLTVDELEKIGVIQGHGEPELAPAGMPPGMPGAESGLNTFNELLSQDYQVTPVTLADIPQIDPSIGTIVWARPQEEVSAADLFKIDQFLMRGGKLGLFIDKVSAELQQQQATELTLGLDDFLGHYGIAINNDLVGDAQCGSVQMRQGGGGLMALFAISMKYPLFVELRNFDRDHPISRDLENAMLFFPSSLDTSAFANARSMGATVRTIVSSSKNSEIQTPPQWNLRPVEKMTKSVLGNRFTAGPQVLAASIEGQFNSYFSGKDNPEGTVDGPGGRLDIGVDSRISIVADGDFVVDGYAQQGNLMLAQNIVDWLSLDDGLIGIRGKTITTRPLDEIESGTKKMLKWLNILGIPLLVIIFGLGRWTSRKRRSQMV